MNRDLVINVLLIIAGIVLAIALFSAGVLWKSRTATRRLQSSLHNDNRFLLFPSPDVSQTDAPGLYVVER